MVHTIFRILTIDSSQSAHKTSSQALQTALDENQ